MDLSAGFLNGLAEAAGLTIHVRLFEGEGSQHVLEATSKRSASRSPMRVRKSDQAKGALMAEKDVITTDRAPGPFQGAPYNQAIRVGDLVFVAGQLGVTLETGELAGPPPPSRRSRSCGTWARSSTPRARASTSC